MQCSLEAAQTESMDRDDEAVLALLRLAATRRPDADLLAGTLSALASRTLEDRSNRLARGLRRLGARPRDVVVVLCCESHGADGAVAACAALKLGARLVRSEPQPDLRRLRPPFVLACEDLVSAWQEAGGRGIVVSNAAGTRWWRPMELKERPEPLVEGRSPVACDASDDGDPDMDVVRDVVRQLRLGRSPRLEPCERRAESLRT